MRSRKQKIFISVCLSLCLAVSLFSAFYKNNSVEVKAETIDSSITTENLTYTVLPLPSTFRAYNVGSVTRYYWSLNSALEMSISPAFVTNGKFSLPVKLYTNNLYTLSDTLTFSLNNLPSSSSSLFSLGTTRFDYSTGSFVDDFKFNVEFVLTVFDVVPSDKMLYYDVYTVVPENKAMIEIDFTFTNEHHITLRITNGQSISVGSDNFRTYVDSDAASSALLESIRQEGYDAGKFDGETIGYNKGFDDARALYQQIGDVSFFSLITSVVDVPVKAFTNLLNFTILGINLFEFMTGLLTLALIITIFRILWR